MRGEDMSEFLMAPFMRNQSEQSLQEKINKLESENKMLKNKINSITTDKITVLTPIAAVDCPRTEQLEEITECQKCQCHNGAVVGEQADKSLYGRVFCSYLDTKHSGMW